MQTILEPRENLKTLLKKNHDFQFKEKVNSRFTLPDIRLYPKLLAILISLSIISIFSESPKVLRKFVKSTFYYNLGKANFWSMSKHRFTIALIIPSIQSISSNFSNLN